MIYDTPAYEMHLQSIEEADKKYSAFDEAYDAAFGFVNYLEEPRVIEQYDENELLEAQTMMIHLSRRGLSQASEEERALLEKDIIQLLAQDDDERMFDAENFLPPLFGLRKDKTAPSFGFSAVKKSVKNSKQSLKKTETFARKYKAEILVAMLVDLAVINTYVVVGRERAAIENAHSTTCLFPYPGHDPHLKSSTQKAASMLAHETWNAIYEEGRIAPQLKMEISYLAKVIYHNLELNDLNTIENFLSVHQNEIQYDDMITNGHEQIANWFSTSYDSHFEKRNYTDPNF